MTAQKHPARASAIGALALIALVLAFGAAKLTGAIDAATAKIGVSVALGGVLVLTGNLIPKLLGAHDPPMARFAGWVFVCTGLAWIATWLLAPAQATLIASVIGLCGFAAVGGFWASRGGRPLLGRDPGEGAVTTRAAMVSILHAILWVFAMFFADALWGDTAAQWLAVWFVVVNGVLISFLISRREGVED